MAFAATCTSSEAGPILRRTRPGSPWMPMPSSISSSPRSNVGVPAAGVVPDVRAVPKLRARSFTFRATAATVARSPPSSASAPPTGRVQAVLHGHVVVHQDRFHLDALVGGELGGELEVHDVTGVVLDDVHHPGTAVHALRRREHLVGNRGSEHRSRTGRV